MAYLTYDFPIAFDRNIEFDAITAPATKSYELDVTVTTNQAELVSDREPVFELLGKREPVFEGVSDSDITSTLGKDSDIELEVEVQ